MLEKLGDLTSTLEDVSTSLKSLNSTIESGLNDLIEEISFVGYEISSGFDTISIDIRNKEG